MTMGVTPFWRRPLPIFIRVVGYLAILYSLLILVAMIGMVGMSLYRGESGSFELATDFGRRYYENGDLTEPLLLRCGFMLFFFDLCRTYFFLRI